MVNKLVLGTAQFGDSYGISNIAGRTSSKEVSRIIEYCKANNLLSIDTASAYGEAEKVLGGNDLRDFKIISKFIPNDNRKGFEKQFINTLNYLRVRYLYGYIAHRPLDLITNQWEWEILKEKKELGLIKSIGFSLNKPSELHRLLDIGFIPDLIQVPFNYLDRRFESDLKLLNKQNVEIHTRSSFLQGLFFMQPEKLSSYFESIKDFLIELHKSTDNLSGSLLRFVLEKEFIDKVIVGVESLVQLKNNREALETADKISLGFKPVNERILMPMYWPN